MSFPLAGAIPAGTVAPAFSLPVSGRPGREDGIPPRGARGLALIAFFKKSCPTCRLTLPLLQRLHARTGAAGGRVLGVSQDGAEGAAAFAAELGLTFPILIDGDGYPVSSLYDLETVPSLYLVDASGAVVASGAGFARAELQDMADRLAASVGLPARPLYETGESFPEFKPG